MGTFLKSTDLIQILQIIPITCFIAKENRGLCVAFRCLFIPSFETAPPWARPLVDVCLAEAPALGEPAGAWRRSLKGKAFSLCPPPSVRLPRSVLLSPRMKQSPGGLQLPPLGRWEKRIVAAEGSGLAPFPSKSYMFPSSHWFLLKEQADSW